LSPSIGSSARAASSIAWSTSRAAGTNSTDAAHPAAATTRSLFGGPTPEQRDQLAVALENRFKSVYPRG
jgi:hypothetical protein